VFKQRNDEGDKAAKSLIESMRGKGWLAPILIFCGENHTVLDICAQHPNVFTSTSASLLNLFFETMTEYADGNVAVPAVGVAAEDEVSDDPPASPKKLAGKSNTKVSSNLGSETVQKAKEKPQEKEKKEKETESEKKKVQEKKKPVLEHQATELLEPDTGAKPKASSSSSTSAKKKQDDESSEDTQDMEKPLERKAKPGKVAAAATVQKAEDVKKSSSAEGEAKKKEESEPNTSPPPAPGKLVLAFTQEDESLAADAHHKSPVKTAPAAKKAAAPAPAPAKQQTKGKGMLIVAEDEDGDHNSEEEKIKAITTTKADVNDAMDVDVATAATASASPGNCVASMKPRSRVGQLCTVSIQTRDEDDKVVSTGGHAFTVDVKGPVMLDGFVDDHGDGNYTASFFPTRPGSYVVFVKLDDCNIRNSPLRLGTQRASHSVLHSH
jgi:hypothetical protein